MADIEEETVEEPEQPEKEGVIVDLDEIDGADRPEPDPDALWLNEDLPNLVEELESSERGREFLEGVVKDCCELFEEAWDRSSERREKNARARKLFYGETKRKSPPFEGCPTVHIPLMLQNVTRYQNKIIGEVFGDWTEVVQFTALDPQRSGEAELASAHTNWQVARAIPGFKRQMYRAVALFTVLGDVVCHSYRDVPTGKNKHDMLTSDDFVVPWTHVSVTDDFSDVPWVARVLRMHRHEVRRMDRQWSNVDELLDGQLDELELDKPMRDAISEQTGEGDEEDIDLHEIVHWEGYLDLPGSQRDRYCQVVFSRNTQKALSFRIHEEVPAAEMSRYQFEQLEYKQYMEEVQKRQQALEAQANAQQQAEQLAPLAQQVPPDSPEAAQFLQVMTQVQSQVPPEPLSPVWMQYPGQEPEPPSKRPIHMFAHGVCMEPMLGVWGEGIGKPTSMLNEAANVFFNQFSDASTLGNNKTFLTNGPVRFPDGLRLSPGRFNRVTGLGGNIRDNIMELDFKGGNEQLLGIIQMLMKYGEDAGSTPELMSGAAGKSGETARGIQLRAEQAHSMLSVPANRFGDFVLQVLRNNSKLNAKFMEGAEVFYPNRSKAEMGGLSRKSMRATRDIYDNEFELELTQDMMFKSRQQRVSESDELLAMLKQFPMLATNQALVYTLLKGSLIQRGRRDIVALLGQPPQPGPGPLGTAPQPPAPPGAPPGDKNGADKGT